MGLREQYGPLLEAALNTAVDKYLDGEMIKKELHEAIDKLVDAKLDDLKKAIKEGIDKIDGEDDLA